MCLNSLWSCVRVVRRVLGTGCLQSFRRPVRAFRGPQDGPPKATNAPEHSRTAPVTKLDRELPDRMRKLNVTSSGVNRFKNRIIFLILRRRTTDEPARKKRPHPESHMMTMLRAPTATKQGAERSRSDGLDGVERFFCLPPSTPSSKPWSGRWWRPSGAVRSASALQSSVQVSFEHVRCMDHGAAM